MIKTRSTVVAVLASVLMVSASGCDALSGLMKLADCNGGFLTGGEIKALNQSVRDFLAQQNPGIVLPDMTDAQAEAAASFLQANSANCLEEITAVAEQASQDPSSVQGLAALAAAFDGTDHAFDPENPTADDIERIFGGVFGGQNYTPDDYEGGDNEGPGGGPHHDDEYPDNQP